jgi:hypothetical protein
MMTSREKALRELAKRWLDWNSTAMTPITCAKELLAILDAPAEEVGEPRYDPGWHSGTKTWTW